MAVHERGTAPAFRRGFGWHAGCKKGMKKVKKSCICTEQAHICVRLRRWAQCLICPELQLRITYVRLTTIFGQLHSSIVLHLHVKQSHHAIRTILYLIRRLSFKKAVCAGGLTQVHHTVSMLHNALSLSMQYSLRPYTIPYM